MKNATFFIGLTILLFSCKPESEKLRPVVSLSIETVFEDTLSIRAIEVWNDTTLWFGSDQGIIGVLTDQKPKLAKLTYNDTLLAVRSIARTAQSVFLLNAGSPAVLYKSFFNGDEVEFMTEVYTETHPAAFYDSMTFSDELNGVAMGDPTDGCMSVLITTNGGLSWKKIPCSQLPPALSGEAGFAASNSSVDVVGNHIWLATGGGAARVFHSPDFGKSWEVFNTPVISGKPMQGIFSLDFYDENKGIIFGGDWNDKSYNQKNKAITGDGGKTWQLVVGGSNPGYRSCVQFFPDSDGNEIIAVGTEGIDYSSDGGYTWKKLSAEPYYTLRFVGTDLAYAAGKGRISKIFFKR